MREHDRGQRVAEDYVAAIATIAAEGQAVIGARLAKLFGVSAPTVTETLRRLHDSGYLDVHPNKDVTLTDAGRDLARRTLHRRRVAERFCVDALGLSIAEAQVEADRLEHALSDATADRLGAALGDPDECPHGDPVNESARVTTSISTTLDHAPIGVDLVVEHVSSEAGTDEDVLADLAEAGLMPGSRLAVLAPDGDGMKIRSSGGDVRLSSHSARAVRVRQARSPRATEGPSRTEPRFRVSVSSVLGACVAGHRSGEEFEFSHCAPSGLCLEALQKLYPAMSALRLAGPTATPIQVPCPEDGIVTFTLESDPAPVPDDGTKR